MAVVVVVVGPMVVLVVVESVLLVVAVVLLSGSVALPVAFSGALVFAKVVHTSVVDVDCVVSPALVVVVFASPTVVVLVSALLVLLSGLFVLLLLLSSPPVATRAPAARPRIMISLVVVEMLVLVIGSVTWVHVVAAVVVSAQQKQPVTSSPWSHEPAGHVASAHEP
jgi:hypothetical protein